MSTITAAATAAGGTHVCLRAVDTAEIWRLLRDEGITHFSVAPTVLTMIAEDPAAGKLDHEVHVDISGAPPSATLLARMGKMGFAVTHLYGLTETYGPLAINEWQPEWEELPPDERARLRARQGAPNLIAPPAAGPGRRRPGRAGRRRDHRRDRGQRQRRDARLLPRRAGDPGGHPQRLLPDRRPGRDAPRRLRRDPRPEQGHHHLRRREHRLGRGRAGAGQPPRGDRKRRGGHAAPALGRCRSPS